VFDHLEKAIIESLTGDPQVRDRAQEQLKPVLDRRFQPCLELWKDLWQFADNAPKSILDIPANYGVVVSQLLQKVDSFLHENGALISYPTLVALSKFQKSLQKFDPSVSTQVVELLKQVYPSSEKDHGLLLLLRDEIGSNAKAASSILK